MVIMLAISSPIRNKATATILCQSNKDSLHSRSPDAFLVQVRTPMRWTTSCGCNRHFHQRMDNECVACACLNKGPAQAHRPACYIIPGIRSQENLISAMIQVVKAIERTKISSHQGLSVVRPLRPWPDAARVFDHSIASSYYGRTP